LHALRPDPAPWAARAGGFAVKSLNLQQFTGLLGSDQPTFALQQSQKLHGSGFSVSL
jgi:hypothetical protein